MPLLAQPFDHLERVDVTLFAGLERDEQTTVVLRGVAGAVTSASPQL